MYTIYVDDALLYQTGQDDPEHVIMNPKLSLDVNSAGSLSFVMPPGHVLYDAIRKMKSIVTVTCGGEIIFRGRVTEDKRDFYNQLDVYCEGDRSFLLDSLWEERQFTGSVKALFESLVDNHNAQVEEEKRFTVGIVTAVNEQATHEAEVQVNTRRFWDTQTMLEDKLLGAYGGYIRTRTQGDAHFIDWIKDFDEESAQTIRFSVNLLDLKDERDAGDVFTCLIPLGYSEIKSDGTYSDPVTIASVNDGNEYIEDEEAVALYGKIWRTKTWGQTKDPVKLKEKAEEYMKSGKQMQTLTLTAVDMCFIDGDEKMIRNGTKAYIASTPHGLDVQKVCAKLDIDLQNPEKTEYTFGVPPQTLSEGMVRAERDLNRMTGRGGGGGRSLEDELGDVYRWAKINVDEANALINLNAGEINKVSGRMSQAEINIDGINANILLKADVTVVDELGRRVSSAEIEIDGLNSEISLKADKIALNGYVTMDEFEAEIASIKITDSSYVTTAALSTQSLDANYIDTNSISIGGHSAEWDEVTVLTGASLEVTSTGGTVTGVKLNKSSKTISYLTH